MKIAILVNSLNQLSNWQYRVIEGICNDPDMEPEILLANGPFFNWRLGHTGNVNAHAQKIGGVSGLLLRTQYAIENKLLFNPPQANYTSNSFPFLNDLKVGVLGTDEPGPMDLLLNLDSVPVSDALLKTSTYGLWELLFKESSLVDDGPVGFWEVVKKKPVVTATLVNFKANLQAYAIVDQAHFNRHWSMTETATIVSEGSVSLLFKCLDRLKNNTLQLTEFSMPVKTNTSYPTLFSTLKYMGKFYGGFVNKLYEKSMAKLVSRRYECWTVFTGNEGFFQDITSSAMALPMPDNEFWADPFLFHHKGTDYLFFENYSYSTKKGKVSCGVLKDNQLTQIVDILDTGYHLSFPFIFEQDGEIFLMPEGSENKTLEIYKAVDFPLQWEPYTTAFEGEAVGDAFFHTDQDQQQWLFLNKQAAPTSPMNSELFIYKVDGVKLNTLIPHQQNPVLIDASVARNGGAIFMHEGEYYRPSQRNTDGVYGRALNINKIEKLTLEEYRETTVQVIEPDFEHNLMGLHHLHECNGKFVFDAAYRYK
ncbi:hypothetical protein Q2T41_19290 [Maribacter confluentis]|uniref:Glucosamine inositolphosphorylceramide transferase 1 N-terminal domain-containing protein n=1 Tax=Maribacter confluentis TaxID=1656093 RepID=A0ABT8RWE7_9FLAO|nr:hypothetical protein [Maribacter confluentis]MDO1513676.1 hypothetical protein [Maribacter confluentis]MDO1514797.1 hypothetical protein [Maribacter confluentis]